MTLIINSRNSITTLKNTANLEGIITASYGKRFGVELSDKSNISCVTRGKKTDLACGDHVNIKRTAKSEGVIESFAPRKTLLYRSNAFRTKLLAANVTQIIIVLATQPSFYIELLNRCLVAAEAAGIKAFIVLNKCDLNDDIGAFETLKSYEQLGYSILAMSAAENIEPLKPYLQNEISVLVGQSGMGKSTIVNALLPNERVKTREVSEVLDSGKHTTTATHLYHLNDNSHLIDSPGLQEFGLNHLTIEQVEQAFIEFRPFLGHCRFNNCRHLSEPDCAILNAVTSKRISQQRMTSFQNLSNELWATRNLHY